MRRGVIALGLAGALSLATAPALADGPHRVIDVTDNEFFPATVTIAPGTEVDWDNHGLAHNVKFDDGSFEQPADPQPTPWRVERVFTTPGVYRYYCEMHGGPGGKGMSGTITVEAGANPTLTGLRVKPRKVCNRRTKKCRKARVTIAFKLSEAARVAGGLDPVGKPAGRPAMDLAFKGKPGRNTFRVAAKKLKPGSYRLSLSAEDTDGNESDVAKAFFRVKRARR
jgi:plastocyanin